MRRLCALCFCVCLVFLSACGQNKTPAEMQTEFTCRVRATYNQLDLEGTLSRQAAGTLSLTVDSPDTLKGVCAVWDGEDVRLRYGMLDFSVADIGIPETALIRRMVAALDSVFRGEGERTVENDTVTVIGTVEGYEYTVTYNNDTGAPETLSVPKLPLTAEFFL